MDPELDGPRPETAVNVEGKHLVVSFKIKATIKGLPRPALLCLLQKVVSLSPVYVHQVKSY